MSEFNEIFIANVYRVAKEKGIRIGDLEEAIGASKGYLSRIRKDTDISPSLEKAASIAAYLGVPLAELMSDTATSSAPVEREVSLPTAGEVKVEGVPAGDSVEENPVRLVVRFKKDGSSAIEVAGVPGTKGNGQKPGWQISKTPEGELVFHLKASDVPERRVSLPTPRGKATTHVKHIDLAHYASPDAGKVVRGKKKHGFGRSLHGSSPTRFPCVVLHGRIVLWRFFSHK